MSEVTVGVRELKAQLSAYLRQVKAGQTIVITERGTPIGRITPAGAHLLTIEEKMQRLVDAGLVEWSGQKPEPFEPVAVNDGPVLASDLVVEMRG